jgi:hypothetical protein
MAQGYVGPFDAVVVRMLETEPALGSRELGRRLGLAESSVRRILARVRPKDGRAVDDPPHVSDPRYPWADPEPDTADERTIDNADCPQICTLDALLAHASLSLDEWEVLECTPNAWTGGDGSQHFQIKARLKRRREVAMAHEIWGHLELAIERRLSERQPTAAPAVILPRRLLQEVDAMDVHLGKLAWQPETGEDYDMAICRRTFEQCVTENLAAPSAVRDEIVLPVGNDFFNVDNLIRTTTGGTPQDGDSRYAKMFSVGVEMNVWAIEQALHHGRRVVVKIVPGNHDRQSAFTLGTVLAAWFRHEPRVWIDNAPTLRKYHRFGTNLLGWTHGSEEKLTDLAVIMATEAPAMWSRTTCREWHVGHLHKMKQADADSVRGVRFRIMPSISATDAWHNSKGYRDRRAMESYLYDYDRGYVGHYSANVLEAPASAPQVADAA